MMVYDTILFAALTTAVVAQVGRRHPYGIYPSASITSFASSSNAASSSSSYSSSASEANTTLIVSTSSIDTMIATSSSIISAIPGPPVSWTTDRNGSFTLITATSSVVSATSTLTDETTATSTSATSPRATCASVTIGNVAAGGLCGCEYNIQTCMERLSNLSEWSISQTTESFGGCLRACDGQPNCFSFTWETGNGSCKMFGGMLSGGAGVVSEAGFISGEVVKGSCTGSCSGQ